MPEALGHEKLVLPQQSGTHSPRDLGQLVGTLPNLLVIQGAGATPLLDCPAGVISQHTHPPRGGPTHSNHDKSAPVMCVWLWAGNERSQNPQRRAGTADDGPSASHRHEFALGVTDPLTKGISGPSRWPGQGWRCLMPTRATVQVLTERL